MIYSVRQMLFIKDICTRYFCLNSTSLKVFFSPYLAYKDRCYICSEAAIPQEHWLHHRQRVLRAVQLLWHEVHPRPLPPQEAPLLRGDGHGEF